MRRRNGVVSTCWTPSRVEAAAQVGVEARRVTGDGGDAMLEGPAVAAAKAISSWVARARMQDTLSHDAAHALAGGGAGALRGPLFEHALRAAFVSGLDSASVAAGVTGMVSGALVVVLVRTPRCDGHGRGTGEAGDGIRA